MASDTNPTAAFLLGTPLFHDFASAADPDLYAPVPDDWTIGLADVVASTQAIAEGRYKVVNMVGAAPIAAVSNALGRVPFPYVFEGDGANFAVGPGERDAALAALAATAAMAREEFGLLLRTAAIPVATVREAGLDVRVARVAVSPDVAYAMFAGGGLAWAEGRMKAGEHALPPAPPGTRPDITGLTCRFDPSPSRHGVILSLIVRPQPGQDGEAYRALVGRVLAMVDESPGMARPLPEGGPPLRWPPIGLAIEAAANRQPGRVGWPATAGLFARTLASNLLFKLGIRLGAFDPDRYIRELVANSDYRKYDDGVRMTLDCPIALADRIEAQLEAARAAGIAAYGVHRQDAALVTCITPVPSRRDHIHFVDGAGGGYAAAASALKELESASTAG
ncbi:MAG: DUF3095 domain-containing protein [Methylobacteriaceae bacterium]|nr:DUF3095 domain-containing protein [Methylobacteriaceae bacterium]